MKRRDMLNISGMALAASALRPALAKDANRDNMDRRLKVLVAGAHPDDPESGCGGTILRYTDMGHTVVSLYLTRGEAGISGVSHKEAADIRTREAKAACKIMKARPLFAGQIDGGTEYGCDYAEAFIHHVKSPEGFLPGKTASHYCCRK